MLKKKTHQLASDLNRQDDEAEPEMIVLTDTSACGSSWIEQDIQDTSCSTEPMFPGAPKKHKVREPKLEQHRQQRGRRSLSPSSVAEVPEGLRHSVLNINSPAPKGRRQQWYAMWFVQVSVVVVALMVAASIALVFTLRDADVQDEEGDRHLEDYGSYTVADGKNTFDPAINEPHSAHGQGQGPQAKGRKNVRADEPATVVVGSPSTGSIESGGSSTSPIEDIVPSSPASAGVIWLEGGGFVRVRAQALTWPPPDGASELDGGRRRPPASAGEKGRSAVVRGAYNSSSSALGEGKEDTSRARSGRSLKRLDRKAIAKKKELMELLKN
ncbi:uncharacterized protein [Dermacentor albipictus]|uniref:uncharacterized protein isoform X1 n=2 Tax=Dermacentor albipictus TaxID=60249 RepID=UPI0031FD0BC9